MDVSDTATFRQLRYFIAIAEEKSIRAAAERLNISQPPLSRQLRELEASFGCELFTRSSRGVVLTPVGLELYRRAKDILNRVQEAYEETSHIISGTGGALSIGYTDDFQYGLFPAALSRFKVANPKVHIRLVQHYSGRLGEMVGKGELDIALISPPLEPHLKEVASATIDFAPLSVLMAPDHPLAKREQIHMRELSSEAFIMATLMPGSGFYIQVVNLFRRANISPLQNMEIYPTAMIANLVAAGHGVSLVTPDSLDPQRKDVVRVFLRDEGAVIERAVIWRRGFSTRVARRFYEELTGAEFSTGV